jgi:DNA-binding SARP family transcriptional activator/Tfp pilus assembly protein PilF
LAIAHWGSPVLRAPNDCQTLFRHTDPRFLLTLLLLGDLRLERDGTVLLAGRRKPLALLAFLARRAARTSSREELAALLWGSGEDANARKSLRQSLSDLRTVEGLSFNETDAGISIAPGTLSTDIDFLDADLRSAAWVQAIGRWRGDFLASAEMLGGADWQHWLDAERTAQRAKLALACDQATTAAERAGEWRRSLELATRWRTLLPDDGRAWFREITALQSIGQVSDAVLRVAQAEQHFRELGAGIPDDLGRLSRVLSRVRDVAGTPAASLLTPDMVGRSGPLEALSRARVGTRLGDGRSVLVMAPEGLGKTRLVREFARTSRESDREALIVEVSANPSDRLRPLSFLQGIVGALAPQDALAACAPETLAVLAEVTPAIRTHFRHLPSSGSGDLHAALRSALEEVARDKPVLLLLDDLPDADDRSQSVIASILLSPVTGILAVATGRPESWYLSASLADVPGRLDRGEQYALEPLTVDEVRKLLASMAPLAPAAITTLTTTLHEQSGGNPGLITSTMAHLAISSVLTADHTGAWSLGTTDAASAGVPPAVEARWRARCREMSAGARTVIDALAVLSSAPLNTASELHQLEQLAALEGARFKEALEYLRLSAVLRVTGSRVSFSADLFRRLASSEQLPSARNALHGRAARILGRVGTPVAREAAAFHRQHSGQVARTWKIAATLVIAATLSAATWYGTRWNAARVPPRTPVLLADVVNLTGDSVFDQTLYYAASVGLQQSRQVSLFTRSRVRETLSLMQRPGADSMLDESLAREVAVRENLRSVVQLSVARGDRSYLVGGRVIDPSSGDDLFAHQERARNRDEVLDALERVLNRIRRSVGESRDSIRAFSAPLPRVTTASLPALEAYASAINAFSARRYPDAKAAYARAVELDSSFALAWLGLAEFEWIMANNRETAFAALQRAERHSERLTERERLRLAQTSAGYRGNAAEELRISETLANRFPEVTTWYNLGTKQMRVRRCPEAIASFEKALGFDSSHAGAHINTATCHQFLGAYRDAVLSYNRAYGVDSFSVYQGTLNHEFGIALVRAGFPDSARAVFERMVRRPTHLDQQYGHRSIGYHAAWTGHWRSADAHFDSAATLSRAGTNFILSEFRNRVLQAELLLTAQQEARARQSLEQAWALRTKVAIGPPFAMFAGLAYVRAGQLDRATEMLRILNSTVREGSTDDRTVRAILTSRIALAQQRTGDARRALMAATDTTWIGYTLPVLVDAMVALDHRDSALVAATQLEHRSVFGTDAQDAWLRNLLIKGRLAEQSGQRMEATSAYSRLESQLRAGDPDHPLLVASRLGLARVALTDSRR